MRWTPGDRSNVEDLRGRSGMRAGLPLGIGGVLVLLVLSWVSGVDLLSLFSGAVQQSPTQTAGTSGKVAASPAEEQQLLFVDAVMRDVQQTWGELLPGRYEETRARLFRDSVQSACGFAQSASGPFYCPGDRKVYLDLGFFDELRKRLGAEGDFAQAYVLAHEVGHHVQSITGIEQRVRAQSARGNANALSVRLELQADCFAGVWGHAASGPGRSGAGKIELEEGDVEEGLNAAAAIGDDRLQRMQTGHVVPDKFTHGSSAQRVTWFKRGLQSGNPESCDTFGAGQTN